MTRTNNSHVDATSFSRMGAYKKDGVLYIVGNLSITGGNAFTGFVEIGKISNWNACSSIFMNIPAQNGGSSVALIVIESPGTMLLYFAMNHVDSFYRFNTSVAAVS